MFMLCLSTYIFINPPPFPSFSSPPPPPPTTTTTTTTTAAAATSLVLVIILLSELLYYYLFICMEDKLIDTFCTSTPFARAVQHKKTLILSIPSIYR